MNPREFLDVADELAMGASEGFWRSAVSRAYYASFHSGCRLLERCGFVIPEEERAHVSLIRRLTNCGRQDIGEAGRRLDSLRAERNRADYRLQEAFAQTESIDLVQRAAGVIDLLEQAVEVPEVCAQITQAMREYERTVLQEVTWRDPSSSP